jgi:long-chain acyl-CoA synthetase
LDDLFKSHDSSRPDPFTPEGVDSLPNDPFSKGGIGPNRFDGSSDQSIFRWPLRAESCGGDIALIFEFGDGELGHFTWLDLSVAVFGLCEDLDKAGFVRGDRLVHGYGNTAEGVLIALASSILGTVEVPLDPFARPADHDRLCEMVRGRILPPGLLSGFVADSNSGRHLPVAMSCDSPGTAGRLLDRLATHAASEASLILFTSGTGGRAKAVTLSRGNLISNAAAKWQAAPQSADDVRLTVLPIYHAYARTCDLGTWLLSGGTLAITAGWDGWNRIAARVRPTLLNTVPSFAMRLVDLPTDAAETRRLRMLGCGGAALSDEIFDRLSARGITVIQGYGMTEASPVICSATPADRRPGYVGRPVSGWQTRVDPDGRLWVRGDGVMIGYWDGDRPRSEAISDGWLDTGDIVEIDPADSQFRILGRADDRITLSNGRKVYPMLIEQRVMRIAGVRHAIVLGDDRHIEVWIDIDPGLPAASQTEWTGLVAAVVEDLPEWQRPRRVAIIPQRLDSIPGILTAKGTPVRQRVLAAIHGQWRPALISSE